MKTTHHQRVPIAAAFGAAMLWLTLSASAVLRIPSLLGLLIAAPTGLWAGWQYLQLIERKARRPKAGTFVA